MKNTPSSTKVKSKLQIVGEISVQAREQRNFWLKKWNLMLRSLETLGIITRHTLERFYAKGMLVREYKVKNIIANAGLNAICEILAGDYADTGAITHMALGDGVGTPAVGDTTLFNEVYRNATASSTSSVNVAICTAFYTETEVSGTFTEFGNFIDGTGTVDTGLLWSHVNVAWTKTNTETYTVACRYTLTNA